MQTVSEPPSFLIVEDDVLVASWLKRAFQKFRPVATATCVEEGCALLADPALRLVGVVVDIGLPDGSGLEVVRAARARRPAASVLVLTGSTQPKVVNGSFLLGASFLTKPTTLDSLTMFARRALACEGVGDTRVRRAVETFATEWALTDRETELLGFAVADKPRSGLAKELGVCENTAKTHVKSLLRKSASKSLDDVVKQVLRQALAA